MGVTENESGASADSHQITHETPGALGAGLAAAAEGIIRTLEASPEFAKLGQQVAGIVGKFLPPGSMKDLVSGTWMGHPAHPMLTDIPIGAWTSALFLDFMGKDGADTLIGLGILAALPTAVTGLSELADFGTDPDFAVGAAHALANMAALGLFSTSWLARKAGSRSLGFMLSLAATGLMTGAGFLGGHLSFRRGIGVNHTAYEWGVDDWTPVLADADLPLASPTLVNAGGTDVMLLRRVDGICALSDRCTHAGGPLHEGSLDGDRIICPWHASAFHVQDGSVARGPATAPQPAYDTRVREGQIEVRSRK
ncbi:MAG TPA: Rieske 2Fe-2S domain-containing protein [Actinomycetota bacterium]|nr:Rieske 2Fe-2S domain-containing protein [Actinomycetota bacterium]